MYRWDEKKDKIILAWLACITRSICEYFSKVLLLSSFQKEILVVLNSSLSKMWNDKQHWTAEHQSWQETSEIIHFWLFHVTDEEAEAQSYAGIDLRAHNYLC